MKRKVVLTVLVIMILLSAASCGSEPAKTGLEYAEEIAAEELPEGLSSFLIRFSLYSETGVKSYDAADPGDVNMLLAVGGTSFIADPSVYGMDPVDFHFFEEDPENRGASHPYYAGYVLRNADDVIWIAQNIFHVKEEDIEKMEADGEEKDLFYRCSVDGTDRFCFYMAGFGDSDPLCLVDIRAARTDGERYYIVYDEVSEFGDLYGTFYAVADTTDNGYWTLYSRTDEIPEAFGIQE